MSLHERLKRIEDRLAKLEATATEHAEFIATGESHTRERDALRAAVTVAKTAGEAMVVQVGG